MGFKCYFCDTRDRVGYWSNWCDDCANLRRMLLLYDPKRCCDILKRTLTRDEKQIDFKVSQEIKKKCDRKIGIKQNTIEVLERELRDWKDHHWKNVKVNCQLRDKLRELGYDEKIV